MLGCRPETRANAVERPLTRRIGVPPGFRPRGLGEITRIEALSDAVFAFAITLLVVSLEVPKTFAELMHTMGGFLAFAITFVLLFQVWFEQYKFFRRYGLEDNFTIWINACLLFVVLFYVYPLKFVWNLVVDGMLGREMSVETAAGHVPVATLGDVPVMMAIFGGGFVAVFSVFVLLYTHAYRKRRDLELSPLETFDTRVKIQEHLLNVTIGVLSIAFALLVRPELAGLSGYVYFLLGPTLGTHGALMGRLRRRRFEVHQV